MASSDNPESGGFVGIPFFAQKQHTLGQEHHFVPMRNEQSAQFIQHELLQHPFALTHLRLSKHFLPSGQDLLG